MTKPNLISKFFRIGTSGATVDGRNISASDINDMAETYDQDEYTAVLNYEHFSFYSGWGKVIALKAETDKKNRRVLLAQIEPTARLLEINQSKQKLFTSMEIAKNFAKSGKAYLVGLAITDRPASLGVEALHFSTQKDTNQDDRFDEKLFTKNIKMETFKMKDDKTPSKDNDNSNAKDKENLSAEDDNSQGKDTSWLDKFNALFSPQKKQADDDFSDLQTASLQLAQKYSDLSELVEKFQPITEDLSRQILEQGEEIKKLTAALENTPEGGGEERPAATGENENETDC